MSKSGVLEDINPIFKIFKNLLGGPSEFLVPRLFQTFRELQLQHFEISEIRCPKNDLSSSLDYFRHLGVSELNINWFGESLTRPKSENHEHDGLSVSPKAKSKSYY